MDFKMENMKDSIHPGGLRVKGWGIKNFPEKKPHPRPLILDRGWGMIKTENKLFEKLLCVLLIHLTELQLFPQEAFR